VEISDELTRWHNTACSLGCVSYNEAMEEKEEEEEEEEKGRWW